MASYNKTIRNNCSFEKYYKMKINKKIDKIIYFIFPNQKSAISLVEHVPSVFSSFPRNANFEKI